MDCKKFVFHTNVIYTQPTSGHPKHKKPLAQSKITELKGPGMNACPGKPKMQKLVYGRNFLCTSFKKYFL